MANDCIFEMKVVGSKKAIQNILDCLEAGYNYSDKGRKPDHKHLFSIFEINPEKIKHKKDNIYSIRLWGRCAWSVYCCMCSGEDTYYDDCKEAYPDIFMGTCLEELSQDCAIEVFSEEPGMGFSEHFLYKNGDCLEDDCVELCDGGYDEYGIPTDDIDWDDYDGEVITFNENKTRPDGDFNWVL